MKYRILILFCLLLTACRASQPADKVLFADGFSDPQSGWKLWTNDVSFVVYEAETLRFVVNEAQVDVISHPGKNYTDALLFVTAELAAGSSDNHYGLICRYQDENNYYAFLVSSDGYAGIIKVKDGQVQMLSAPVMEYQEAVRQGAVKNDIAAGCVGDQLGLVVNAETIYQVRDADFSAGDVGLLAGTHAQPGVDVRFDNLVVLQP